MMLPDSQRGSAQFIFCLKGFKLFERFLQKYFMFQKIWAPFVKKCSEAPLSLSRLGSSKLKSHGSHFLLFQKEVKSRLLVSVPPSLGGHHLLLL